jgi:hypothetical protein
MGMPGIAGGFVRSAPPSYLESLSCAANLSTPVQAQVTLAIEIYERQNFHIEPLCQPYSSRVSKCSTTYTTWCFALIGIPSFSPLFKISSI